MLACRPLPPPCWSDVRSHRSRSRHGPCCIRSGGRVFRRRRVAPAVSGHHRHDQGAGMRADHGRMVAGPAAPAAAGDEAATKAALTVPRDALFMLDRRRRRPGKAPGTGASNGSPVAAHRLGDAALLVGAPRPPSFHEAVLAVLPRPPHRWPMCNTYAFCQAFGRADTIAGSRCDDEPSGRLGRRRHAAVRGVGPPRSQRGCA